MNRTLLALLTFLCFCCKDEGTPPPPYVPSITLEAVDASCTEAWLRACTNATPTTVRLLRGSQRVSELRLLTAESLLVDEGLLPNHQYSYQLQKLGNDSNVVETSTLVQLTTMDTTSHDFTFEIDTLGATSSVLNDVAIISENNVWAAGELYLNDSTGQVDPVLYNAAHWDATRWEIKRISVLYRGSWIIPTLNAVLAFSATDIWFSSGVPIHGDGQNWTQYHLFDMGILTQNDGSISKIWGSSSSDLWLVGNRGTIVHYSSGTWQRVESGTTLRMHDVYGTTNGSVSQNQILSVASDKFTNHGVAVLKISGSQAIQMQGTGLPSTSLVGIWSANGRKWYVCGDGIYTTNNINASWQTISGVPPIYTEAVRGNASNDFFVVGDFGLVLHWNGLAWRYYSGNGVPAFPGQYQAVAVKGGTVIAVGFLNNGQAIALRGRR